MSDTQICIEFTDRFLRGEYDPYHYTLAELIEFYEMELGEAKKRWPSLKADSEWADMDEWVQARTSGE